MPFLFSLVLFTMLPLLSIFPSERHASLSCSRQHIELLPEIVLTEDFAPQEQIIFLHIPKTAGTNLDAIASAVSQKKGAFHYQRLAVPGLLENHPSLLQQTGLEDCNN